ncbi:hypothetical protein [uncultured Photobacterium sp.]|uniref:hypothetical protein n=1 Tax=uncultured Photobacterium sp. TaxID=173973 RepID=UPI0026032EAE|nr:hypothetical protein [uncultured Photobacterium sp.]
MKYIFITCLSLWVCSPAVANELPLGDSLNQLVRLQTVDPLAENRVPTGSPPFSGKKANKSINTEQKGVKSEKVKNKKIIVDN